jgi:predicted acylesterase/phospholipase RssA
MSVAPGAGTAMVLSGGAAYGAYEVGVMLALFQGESPATGGRPLEVDQFAGTSIGSYNAGVMIAGAANGLAESARRLSRIWLDDIARAPNGCENGMFRVRATEFLNVRCLLRPSTVVDLLQDGRFFLQGLLPSAARFSRTASPLGPDTLTRALLGQLNVSAVFDLSPFKELLRRTIPLSDLGAAGIPLKVITSNFDTGDVNVFTERDLVDRLGQTPILASSSLPGFFPAVEIDGALHVDGGALMNTPILPALAGSDTLHVVYVDAPVDTIRVADLQSTLAVIDRMLVTSFAFSMNQDIDMIRDFNRTRALLDQGGPAAESDQPAGAAVVARWLRANGIMSPTTIHRYHPGEDLGGALGFLDLTYEHISSLIKRGYSDAVRHDCAASGCVLNGGEARG